MKRIIVVTVLLAMLMSGCSMLIPAIQQEKENEARQSTADMLAQALALSDAGNYEEAILLYEAVIAIEPNNYEAGYGLGHAYRKTGRTGDAIEALKNAVQHSGNDKQALYELGYAYLDAGEYQKAREVVRTEPVGDDMAPEVAVLLVLSYSAEGDYDRAVSLFDNKSVQDYLLSMGDGDVLYFGQFNAAGQKHGKGVGIYNRGQYVYYGEYKNGLRSGHGVWLRGIRLDDETGLVKNGDSKRQVTYYDGAWENDKPNGYGENYVIYPNEGGLVAKRSGNYTNGYEDGEMTVSFDDHIAPYVAKMGVRELNGKKYKPKEGPAQYYYAMCKTHNGSCEGNWTLKEYQVDAQWGVVPWGVQKVADPNAAKAE